MQIKAALRRLTPQDGHHEGNKGQQLLTRMWERGPCLWKQKLPRPLWASRWRLLKNQKIELWVLPRRHLHMWTAGKCRSKIIESRHDCGLRRLKTRADTNLSSSKLFSQGDRELIHTGFCAPSSSVEGYTLGATDEKERWLRKARQTDWKWSVRVAA